MGKSDYTFRYTVRNWPEYNRALVKRGQLTLWFDTEGVAAWRHPGPFEGRGRPKVYADAAIQCALVLNSVFHLNLRTTQGFLQSIVALMALDLPVPNYSTESRRQSAVDVRLSVRPTDRPRHVVIDSTGLKIYGAGEWHIRKHRTLRRRTWRKLHLGVDETTKEIVAMDLTASNVHDARRLSSLLSKTPGSIGQVSADRAYDTGSCYEAVLQHDAIVTILPRRNARCSRDSHPPPWRAMRDTHLRRAVMSGGECGLTVQGDTRGKPLGPHGQEPKSRSRDQVRCAEPDGGAWNATIGARVLRRMSFSARFAASANYATTPVRISRRRKLEMSIRKYKPEQIIGVLRQIEVQMANGKTAPQACKEAGIHTQTYDRWRKEYGGLKLDQAKRLKELEKENTRLKRLVAERSLEKQVLQEVAEGNF